MSTLKQKSNKHILGTGLLFPEKEHVKGHEVPLLKVGQEKIQPISLKIKRLPEIRVNEYYERVCSICAESKVKIIFEQARKAIGGISNLYFEAMLNLRKDRFTVFTNDFFTSDPVDLDDILIEISNCSGVNKIQSKKVYESLQEALKEEFKIFMENNSKLNSFLFPPIGRYEVLGLNPIHCRLTYVDPAAKDYMIAIKEDYIVPNIF